MAETNIILARDEIRAITGFSQAPKQLDELKRQGFWRARIAASRVILERSHYEAVCAAGNPARRGPKVKPISKGSMLHGHQTQAA